MATRGTIRFDNGASVHVEIVSTPAEIQRGLSFRSVLPDGTGMLFQLPGLARHAFWMKDTWIPLDIVFLRGGVIVGLLEHLAPLDLTVRRIEEPSDAALEVPAGWARRSGIIPRRRHTNF